MRWKVIEWDGNKFHVEYTPKDGSVPCVKLWTPKQMRLEYGDLQGKEKEAVIKDDHTQWLLKMANAEIESLRTALVTSMTCAGVPVEVVQALMDRITVTVTDVHGA